MMETRLLNQKLASPALFIVSFVCLAVAIIPCSGQKAVIYSPSPCDIQCEEITDPTCHFATYTYTGFPNLLGHTKQGYVEQFDHLIELLELCYDKSLEFLCGILTPECVEGVGLRLPTKKICQEFHEECDEFIEEAGHSFLMDCDVLPEDVNAPPVCIHFPTVPPGHTMPPDVTEKTCGGASSVSASVAILLTSFACYLVSVVTYFNIGILD